MPDFGAAVEYVASYSTVELALLVDDEGLCVSRACRASSDSDMWAPDSWQWGWRLVPRENRVTFDLHVLHIESGHAEERHCEIVFADDHSVTRFGFFNEDE